MAKMPVQTKTINGKTFAAVRIPVAINGVGEWIADGVWSRCRDTAMREVEMAAAECGYGSVVTHFVYALVPVPDGSVIAGEIDDDWEL